MRKLLIAGIGSGLSLALLSSVAVGLPGSAPPAPATAGAVILAHHGGAGMGHAMGHSMSHSMGHAMGHSVHMYTGSRLAYHSHAMGHHHHHHHRRVFIAGVPYFYDDYYYDYGYSCGWLHRRAIATGSAYWWRRYRDCLY